MWVSLYLLTLSSACPPPPIRSLSRIVSSLTLCRSGLSWLGGWVVAQLSLLLVVFGGVGCSNVVVGCCSVAVCRQGAVRVAGSAILSYSLSSIDYWGLPLGLGQCAITHSYVFSYGFFVKQNPSPLRHPESQASELQTRNPQCFVGPGLDTPLANWRTSCVPLGVPLSQFHYLECARTRAPERYAPS